MLELNFFKALGGSSISKGHILEKHLLGSDPYIMLCILSLIDDHLLQRLGMIGFSKILVQVAFVVSEISFHGPKHY